MARMSVATTLVSCTVAVLVGFATPSEAATCGGGQRGDGICPQVGLCCSQWGWCGSTSAYCGSSSSSTPTTTTTTTSSSTSSVNGPTLAPGTGEADSRLIAYVGNWQACPTLDQVQHYTHIVIAFAVSYTWSPGKNSCSTTCDIATPPVCSNAANPALIQQWQALGKKVILSFGGAGMGGTSFVITELVGGEIGTNQ